MLWALTVGGVAHGVERLLPIQVESGQLSAAILSRTSLVTGT